MTTIFIAGGISGCPDWQKKFITLFPQDLYTFINPRKDDFNPADSAKQIKWEFDNLRQANIISFWFPAESICPITLFEPGVWSNQTTKPVIIGLHPDYPRKFDVEQQMKWARPDIKIVYSLEDLAEACMKIDLPPS